MSEPQPRKGLLGKVRERLGTRAEAGTPSEEEALHHRILDSMAAIRSEVSLDPTLTLDEKVDYQSQFGVPGDDHAYMQKYGSYQIFMSKNIHRRLQKYGSTMKEWLAHPVARYIIDRAHALGKINISNTHKRDYVVPNKPYIEKIYMEPSDQGYKWPHRPDHAD